MLIAYDSGGTLESFLGGLNVEVQRRILKNLNDDIEKINSRMNDAKACGQ